MRVVFVGAAPISLMTARLLIERGHEVIIIEADRSVIEELSDSLDCSFLHGDGSSPEILREADPEDSDILFCLTDHDQTNIIAGLVGRSLGFGRVVASITDTEFEPVCKELGLEDTIVPARTISRYLADMLAGIDVVELRTAIRDEARLFSFTATDDDAGEVAELDLPKEARIVWYYRDEDFRIADDSTALKAGDEVVIATHSKHLEELRERWTPKSSNDG